MKFSELKIGDRFTNGSDSDVFKKITDVVYKCEDGFEHDAEADDPVVKVIVIEPTLPELIKAIEPLMEEYFFLDNDKRKAIRSEVYKATGGAGKAFFQENAMLDWEAHVIKMAARKE